MICGGIKLRERAQVWGKEVDSEKEAESAQLQNSRKTQKHAARKQERGESLHGEHCAVEKGARCKHGEPEGWTEAENARNTGKDKGPCKCRRTVERDDGDSQNRGRGSDLSE